MAVVDSKPDINSEDLRHYSVRFSLLGEGRDDFEKIVILGGLASKYRCNLAFLSGTVQFDLYDVYEKSLEKVVGELLDDIAEFDFVCYEGIGS